MSWTYIENSLSPYREHTDLPTPLIYQGKGSIDGELSGFKSSSWPLKMPQQKKIVMALDSEKDTCNYYRILSGIEHIQQKRNLFHLIQLYYTPWNKQAESHLSEPLA